MPLINKITPLVNKNGARKDDNLMNLAGCAKYDHINKSTILDL
jgi:hypothetical protein